jgi:hypothetical protein
MSVERNNRLHKLGSVMRELQLIIDMLRSATVCTTEGAELS